MNCLNLLKIFTTMNIHRYVLDTCAIISYFKDVFNDDKDISSEIRDEISVALQNSQPSSVRLIVPSMAFIEIRDKWCKCDEIREKIRCEVFIPFFQSENIHICPFEGDILKRALYLDKYDCSFDNHDRYFVAITLEYGCPLITSDTEIKKYQKYCPDKLKIRW